MNRTIGISNGLWSELNLLKRKGESYENLIWRILGKNYKRRNR